MNPACLSIDFEDIAHDFRREHGIDLDGPMREDALARAYARIDGFARSDLAGLRLTFFTTGVLAAKCPAIVARIAADGHEVACHYHFHDPARLDPPDRFAARLDQAIDALQSASGQPALGFRAPRFSLRATDAAHFAALERRLAFDSSLSASTIAERDAQAQALGLTRLRLHPVSRLRISRTLPPVRPGGSYLKLFPLSVTLAAMEASWRGGLVPMVYLHPYEFVADRSFQVAMADMAGLPAHRRLYWALRQSQWHSVGNGSVLAKLRRIAARWRLTGPMRDLPAPRNVVLTAVSAG